MVHVSLADVRDVTHALVLATPVVWLAWDGVAYLSRGRRATESHYLWRLAVRHKWFAPLFGAVQLLLWWHFFWGFWAAR